MAARGRPNARPPLAASYSRVVSAGENAAWVIDQEELERGLREPERDSWRGLWKALMLAKDPETLNALLAGARVA